MRPRHLSPPTALLALCLALPAPIAAAETDPRTPAGRPDFSGNYDVSTLTPLNRPPEFGDNLELTREEAEKIMEEARLAVIESNRNRGPADAPPPEGGAAPIGWDDADTGMRPGYSYCATAAGATAIGITASRRTCGGWLAACVGRSRWHTTRPAARSTTRSNIGYSVMSRVR